MLGTTIRRIRSAVISIVFVSIITVLFASGAGALRSVHASPLDDSPTPTQPGPLDLLVSDNDQGLLGTNVNLEVFGPKQCYTYGDPFSPDLTTIPANPFYNTINPPRIYTYRIAIPADYNQDGKHKLVRVELFDPQTGNFSATGGVDGKMSLPADPTTNFSYMPTWVETPNLSSVPISTTGTKPKSNNQCNDVASGSQTAQTEPCLQGGAPGSGWEIDPSDPFWYVRMDEIRGPNCPGSIPTYVTSAMTHTKFDLYYYKQQPGGALTRTYLAQYTGKRDLAGGAEQAEARRTTLMWVSPAQTAGANPTSPNEQMPAFSCTDINGDVAGTGKCAAGGGSQLPYVSSPAEPRVQVDGVPCSGGAATCPPEYNGTPSSVNPGLPADSSPNSNGDFVINLSNLDFTDSSGNITEPAGETNGIYTDPATGTRYIYLDVQSQDGSSENNYMVWAGPSPAENLADATRKAPAFINARQTYVYNMKLRSPSGPKYHSSSGITVYGVGDLPLNVLAQARTRIPLANLSADYAGLTVTVSLYDSDTETVPPIAFSFDGIDPGIWSQCWEDHDGSTNQTWATTTCASQGSTQAWQLRGATPKDSAGKHQFGLACLVDTGTTFTCGKWAPFTFTVPSATDPLHPVAFNGGRLVMNYQGGSTDTFNVQITVSPPAAPTLIAPADTASLPPTPAFSWTKPDGAIGYQFEYDDNTDFTSPVYTSGEIAGTSFTPPTMAPGTYHWHVRAENPLHQWGAWSAAWTVTILSPTVLTTPTNLTATRISNTRIDLSWSDDAHDFSGFELQRSINGGSTWDQPVTLGPTDLSYSDTWNLVCNTTYTYRVWAIGPSGASSPSNLASVMPAVCVPAAPTNLTATRISNTEIDLAWTSHSTDETGFKVQRRVSGTTTWGTIFTTDAGAVSYKDMGVPCGTFDYQVIATNDGGDSAPSNTATGTGIMCAPAAPTDLAATRISNTEIDLAWTSHSTDETGFKIQRRVTGTTTWGTIFTTAAGVVSYKDVGVPCGTFDYQAIATNDGGDSAPSNTATATGIVCVPAAPTDLTATRISNTEIDLAWTSHSTDETGFKIQRRVTGTTTWGTIFTTATGVVSHKDIGVPCGSFDYQVIATNDGGDSTPSNMATGTGIVCAPAAPSDLTATRISNTEIDLAWTSHSTDETGFKVQRRVTGTTTWGTIFTTAAGVVSYHDTGVPCGTFDYQVIATNDGGDSAPSNTATATGIACVPNAPTDLTATRISNTEIDLAWTSHSTDETGFKVQRRVAGTTTWGTIFTTAAGVVSYKDIGVPCGTFDYQVIATNDGGDSAPSNTATATGIACTTPPAAPSGLSAKVISRNEIDLAWADNSTDETGFKVQRRVSGTTTRGTITTSDPDATGYHDVSVKCSTHYDYQVVATNAAGDSAPSNMATAVTPACLTGKPGQPKITTPSKTLLTNDSTPSFGWTAVANADSYHLQISASSSFKTIKQDKPGLSGLTYTAATLADGVYYVRVAAVNSLGTAGKWSAVRKITVDATPPKVPAFKATITTSIEPTLQAVKSVGAVSYQFQVSTDSGFAAGTILVDVKAKTPSYKLKPAQKLQHHVTYYWRIRAFDQAGNASTWSIGWSFTIHDGPAS